MREERIQEGDKGRGICKSCAAQVSTTYRSVTFKLDYAGGTEVPNVLVGICDTCGAQVVLPHQESPKLNAARRAAKERVREAFSLKELPDDQFMDLLTELGPGAVVEGARVKGEGYTIEEMRQVLKVE